jgi:3-phytase
MWDMRIPVVVLSVLAIVGCAGTGNSPLNNQPGTRFDSAGGRGGTASTTIALKAVRATDPVKHDADDPAIWVNKVAPEQSLILGTDKIEKVGALYVFGLDGKVVQTIENLDRPNNVDVEYDFDLGSRRVDLAVVTERKKGRLLIYAIDQRNGQLTDVTGETGILGDGEGEEKEPMGVGLFRREDGQVFAIVSPKTGKKTNYLAQYRLVANGGKVDLKLVRRFGVFSGLTNEGEGEIEAIAVDDALGVVYYSDELYGVRKYWADPDKPGAANEITAFGLTGYQADREGLGVYSSGEKDGYFLSVDQIEEKSRLFVYTRTGADEKSANRPLKIIDTPADSTDGMEVTSRDLGSEFPKGIVVMMDSKNKRFLIFDWREIASRIGPESGTR